MPWSLCFFWQARCPRPRRIHQRNSILQRATIWRLEIPSRTAIRHSRLKRTCRRLRINTGYVDAFASRLRHIRPNITVINYGCPGESTDSFLNGPCPWTAAGHSLHSAFSGTQLEAAIEFVRAHRGRVSPITLTLAGNDLPILLGPCTANGQIDLNCVQANAPGFIAGFAERISSILRQLRSAAPDAEIIVTGAWDSYATMLAFADPLFRAVNKAMSETAAVNRATFADPFPVFNRQGDLPAEVQTLCRLTLLCTQNDSHPSDAGYQALADVVFESFECNRR
jgi:lysophospholipase L1-like esterase